MGIWREWTAQEYKEHLKKFRESKEIDRCYTQIIWMRRGYEDLMKLMEGKEEGTYFFLKMVATSHMRKKDMIKQYGFLDYDHGELVYNGLTNKDLKAEKIDEMKAAFDEILRLKTGNKVVEDICRKQLAGGI